MTWHCDKEVYSNFQAEGRIFFWFCEYEADDAIPEFDIEFMYEPGTDETWRRWRLSAENDGLENRENAIDVFNKLMSDRKSAVSNRVDTAIGAERVRQQKRRGD